MQNSLFTGLLYNIQISSLGKTVVLADGRARPGQVPLVSFCSNFSAESKIDTDDYIP